MPLRGNPAGNKRHPSMHVMLVSCENKFNQKSHIIRHRKDSHRLNKFGWTIVNYSIDVALTFRCFLRILTVFLVVEQFIRSCL